MLQGPWLWLVPCSILRHWLELPFSVGGFQWTNQDLLPRSLLRPSRYYLFWQSFKALVDAEHLRMTMSISKDLCHLYVSWDFVACMKTYLKRIEWSCKRIALLKASFSTCFILWDWVMFWVLQCCGTDASYVATRNRWSSCEVHCWTGRTSLSGSCRCEVWISGMNRPFYVCEPYRNLGIGHAIYTSGLGRGILLKVLIMFIVSMVTVKLNLHYLFRNVLM